MPKKFNCDDPDLIKITHYVNPHMFWYKYEDSFVMNKEFTIWEDKLQKCFANKSLQSIQCFRAKIGEIVAVYNFTFNRWIRAQCDDIVEFTIANTKYVLWAIDYGIPFQSEGRYIKRMPNGIGEPSEATVFYGGINNIVPVEKEFNFETQEAEMKTSSKWSPLAVRTIENLIYESAHIRFIRQIISRDGQYFGNMEFITHTNKTINAQNCLVEINHATIADDFFRQLRQISTNQVPRWQGNDGNSFVSKFNVNKLSNIAQLEPNQMLVRNQLRQCDFYTEEIAQKITDWTLRNNICQQQVDIDDTESICESTVSLAVTRKIATEKLPVEKEIIMNSSMTTKRDMTAGDRIVDCTENIGPIPAENRQDAFSDDFNCCSDEVEDCMFVDNASRDGPANKQSDHSHAVDCNSVNANGVSQSAVNIVMNRLKNKRRLMLKKLAQQEKAPAVCLPAGFDLRNLQGKASTTNATEENRQNGKFNKRPDGVRNTFANGNHNGFKQRHDQAHLDERW